MEGPLTDISEYVVERALRAMKANKVPGPSGVSSDLKFPGRTGITQLTKVSQQITSTKICPEEWKNSTRLPFSKGKRDPLQCGKYPGLRLLEHGMEVWENILEGRLKKILK